MKHRIILLITFILILIPYMINAGELSGHVSVEGRVFSSDPLLDVQEKDNGSISLKPEYYHNFGNNSSFTFVPFYRQDSSDEKRTHFDIREMNMLWFGDNWEVRAGVGKVFWGVTESQHLVDIVNQTDSVESPSGEEKLGQPMISLSLPTEHGTFDFFILPYFRERTFPGEKGRLRFAFNVDTNNPIYESNEKENHVDGALRYSHMLGDWEFSLSHFSGTGREPTMTPGQDKKGNVVLIPNYELIEQTGLALQYIEDSWIWKLESIYRAGQGQKDYAASTFGFEYTFSGITAGGMDIGALAEWLYDDRGEDATSAMENDIMGGLRLTFNDVESSNLLFGIIRDYKNSSQIFSIEGNRRIGEQFKINIESYILDPTKNDAFYGLRDDDYVKVELEYYY